MWIGYKAAVGNIEKNWQSLIFSGTIAGLIFGVVYNIIKIFGLIVSLFLINSPLLSDIFPLAIEITLALIPVIAKSAG